MPWKEMDPLQQRIQFILEWRREWERQEGRVNLSRLCRAFGVHRPTGRKWVKRYVRAGFVLSALEERSRRPHRTPTACKPEVIKRVVAARKAHPYWGPRKLRVWMLREQPRRRVPSASTIGEILRREGLAGPRKRRRRTPTYGRPFAQCLGPNDVWCIDFKGQFRTGDGTLCYPLTITDAFSRYLIRCEALTTTEAEGVRRVLESAFAELGLPAAIRSDNGPPFASTGAGGLTILSAWWRKLGIRHERIEPGKPQQNGRHERMHRTLRQETADPPKATFAAQQRAFDRFRREFNDKRPHEALRQKTPRSLYLRSATRYPRPLEAPNYSWQSQVRIVGSNGAVRLNTAPIFISTSLVGEELGFFPLEPRKWNVYFYDLFLGLLDEARPRKGLIRTLNGKPGPKGPRRRRA